MWHMSRRGPYAKGVAKREEILSTALEVIARNGFHRTTVSELADAVGLSQTGLLHYFGSKEQLYTQVLRKRDRVDSAPEIAEPAIDTLLRVVRHNRDVPGLVQLYAQLSVDAADPGHAAHEFFAERYRIAREHIGAELRAMKERGELPASLDPAMVATSLYALADGLQTQWLLDHSIDMAAHIEHYWQLITRP